MGLHQWLLAICFVCKYGITAADLHRSLGIIARSASRMLASIKRALYPGAAIGRSRKRRYRSKRLEVNLKFEDALLRLLSTSAETRT